MKTIISMTTIPSRLSTLGPTIKSLLAQTHKPDEIRLHLPPSCIDRLAGIELTPDDGFIKCVSVDRDYGPVTKLYAVRDGNLDPNDLIVTVDDDQIYKPTWLATIMEAAQRWPDDAIGFSGWNVGGFLEGTGSYQFASAPCFCDVLEGWAGAAYRKWFFDRSRSSVGFLVDIIASPPAFQFVDDVWISSRLHKRGIKRRLIAFPMAQGSNPDAPGLHKRLDFIELNRHAVKAGWKLDR